MNKNKEVLLTSAELKQLLQGKLRWEDISKQEIPAGRSLAAPDEIKQPAAKLIGETAESRKSQGLKAGWLLSSVAAVTLGFWIYYVFIT